MTNQYAIIGLIVVVGLGLGLVAHTWSTRRMLPVLEELAAKLDGEVRQVSFFLVPKLVLRHNNTTFEVSSASPGTSSPGGRNTYVLFSEVISSDFRFRIRPKSVQTMVDESTGLKSPLTVQGRDLGTHFSVYTTDERRMQMILDRLSDRDLQYGAQSNEPCVNDIRNYDDKLIYSVSGTLRDYSQYKRLIEHATRFYDAFHAVQHGHSALASRGPQSDQERTL